MIHFNLASERTRIGLNQTELAEKLGTTIQSISKYEKNPRLMPTEFVMNAADLFGCSTDYLYDRTDERLPRSSASIDIQAVS